MNTNEIIGLKLKSIRTLKNLSQESFADLIDYSPSGYAKIERGESALSCESLQQICTKLKISIVDFWKFGNEFLG